MEKILFLPSDCELVMRLLNFVAGKRSAGFIGFADVFDKEPWELIGENSKKIHYFFTQLKKQNKKYSRRFNRVTRSGGIWIQVDKGTPILDEDEKLIIGYKSSLNFNHKKDPSLNGKWMMKEYKDFVVCAIKKNPKSVIKGNEYKRFIDRVLQSELQEPAVGENQESGVGENQEPY